MTCNGPTRKLIRSLPAYASVSRTTTADTSERASLHDVDVRHWLCATLDRVILAMAVAGAHDDLALLNPQYAEDMVLVFDDYFGLKPVRRMAVDQ